MQQPENKQTGVVDTGDAFIKLVAFQLKLAADALRDLLLSPVSIVLFLMDIILKPAAENSYHERLMHLGRRSDRVINLFNEYPDYWAKPDDQDKEA